MSYSYTEPWMFVCVTGRCGMPREWILTCVWASTQEMSSVESSACRSGSTMSGHMMWHWPITWKLEVYLGRKIFFEFAHSLLLSGCILHSLSIARPLRPGYTEPGMDVEHMHNICPQQYTLTLNNKNRRPQMWESYICSVDSLSLPSWRVMWHVTVPTYL